MQKTLLLVFVHGFKGGDDTFGGFPEHLRALVSHSPALRNVAVSAVVYPRFETRGDLKDCVARFREWLQNKVIDLEVAAGTPSPTVDPSVRTILIGHSMGGIVAADTVRAISSEPPITSEASSSRNATQNSTPPPTSPSSFMFPYIQGVLAFDTPYLGIAPSVVAYGAETHYKTASTAYSALADIAGIFGFGGASAASASKSQPPQQRKALTAGPEAAKEALAASINASQGDAAATPAWQRWGRYAPYAGAAAAAVALGAGAYYKKDTLTEGWTWVGSHLEFVGCLMRGEELKQRVGQMVKMKQENGVGFADLITVLGKGGQKPGKPLAGGFIEIGGVDANDRRTFCVTPKTEEWKPFFEGIVNEKAADETVAHMSLFFPRDNPQYYGLAERAKDLITSWVDQGWCDSSESKGKETMTKDPGEALGLSEEDPIIIDDLTA